LSIHLHSGDCLEVMKTISDGSVDMILCDLPYGTTQNKWDAAIHLDELWAEYKRITKPSAAIVLTAQTPFDKVLGSSNLSMLKYEWIWEKENATGFLNAKKAPLKNHENILVFYRTPPTYNPQMRTGFKPYKCKQGRPSTNYGKVTPEHLTESLGERYPVTVLPFSRDRQKIHPTQKPVALMEYLIKTYTNEGDTVLDNCMGSGTTGVACVNTNRSFIGIEKDEKFIEIACNRINSAAPASVSNSRYLITNAEVPIPESVH
jgi:site-specific DNA-methyltransferase (adenine-specific)